MVDWNALRVRQEEYEREAVEDAVRRFREREDAKPVSARISASWLIETFSTELVTRIQREQVEFITGTLRKRKLRFYALPLLSLQPDVLALIALGELIDAQPDDDGNLTWNDVAGAIGRAACRERARVEKEKKSGRNPDGFVDLVALLSQRRKQVRRDVVEEYRKDIDRFSSLEEDEPEWKIVGDQLVLWMQELGLVEVEYRNRKAALLHRLPEFEDLLLEDGGEVVARLLARPVMLPMIVPPLNWTTDLDGGFLTGRPQADARVHRNFLVKHRGHRGRKLAIREAIKGGRMEAVLGVANALQATEWRLNEQVLAVQEAMAEHERLGFPGVPSQRDLKPFWERVKKEYFESLEAVWIARADLFEMEQAGQLDDDWTEWHEALQQALDDRAVLREHYRKLRRHRIAHFESQRALRRTVLLRDRLKENETDAFYLPFQIDYRGRFFAVPDLWPGLGDQVRSLFLFGEGKPLGGSGERWLAISVANHYGYGSKLGVPRTNGKPTLEERERWVRDSESAIRQLAAIAEENGPHLEEQLQAVAQLDCNHDSVSVIDWWCGAKDPWQFLAACLEWRAKDAPGFLSRLPVVIDGTANGLQHMSALTRDCAGAMLTNVVPTADGRPQDIYEVVSRQVKKRIVEALDEDRELIRVRDDEDRSAIKVADLKPWLNHLERGTVKQAVMTIPYGATEESLRKDLQRTYYGLSGKERQEFLDATGQGPFATPDASIAGLARIIQATGLEEVPSAPGLMNWLKLIARHLADGGLGVHWVAPSGLPVVTEEFDYGGRKARRLRVHSGGGTVRRSANYPDTVPTGIEKTRQRRRVVPNLVHSLDSAHLVRVVRRLSSEGLSSYLTVHDAYGVHACDVDRLSLVLREEFKRLHREPILEQVLEAQIARVRRIKDGVERDGHDGLEIDPAKLDAVIKNLEKLRFKVPYAADQFDWDEVEVSSNLFD